MIKNALMTENALFEGISEAERQKLCGCLSARSRRMKRGAYVLRAGDAVRSVYYILSGGMHIIDEDYWGNRSVIETMQAGVLFGEAYVFAQEERHIVSVVAAEDSVVLEIDPSRLFETCANGCACHTALVRNTLYIVSQKIVRLTEKLEHVMRRSIREKLLSYLSACARRAKSNAFQIPYSRQLLADYLCVDRSALSHELSRLQEQKLIRYRKNHFELLTEPQDA